MSSFSIKLTAQQKLRNYVPTTKKKTKISTNFWLKLQYVPVWYRSIFFTLVPLQRPCNQRNTPVGVVQTTYIRLSVCLQNSERTKWSLHFWFLRAYREISATQLPVSLATIWSTSLSGTLSVPPQPPGCYGIQRTTSSIYGEESPFKKFRAVTAFFPQKKNSSWRTVRNNAFRGFCVVLAETGWRKK